MRSIEISATYHDVLWLPTLRLAAEAKYKRAGALIAVVAIPHEGSDRMLPCVNHRGIDGRATLAAWRAL